MNIFEHLKTKPLLFDGGMGTLCASAVPASAETPCELFNLTHPEVVADIHSAYRAAGCDAIKTNTFGANRPAMGEADTRRVIEEGWRIANKCADDAFVFADIGPISVPDTGDLFEEYRFVADLFLRQGAVHFLFETCSTMDALPETAAYIKQQCPHAFILVSFAALPDGFTRAGRSVAALLLQADALEAVDAVGLNCASGARHMAKLFAQLPRTEKPFSVMPNAGYPTVLGNRTFYEGDATYFGRQLAEMARAGARLLGGCCGTTPEHIAAAKEALQAPQTSIPVIRVEKRRQITPENAFWEALCSKDEKPFAVELDPPEDADIERFMAGAQELQRAGAAAVTIADCPIARARMDASLLACKLKRELHIDVLPHMTCRDRNLNAIQALLLGLCAEGVHNVLTVTGDPIPSAARDEVKSVYNFNSRMLAAYITELGKTRLSTPFCVFGALNVNAHNFDVQMRLAHEKEQNGVCGFLTQPILTPRAFENLKRAREELGGKLLGGIFPLVSYRNACFMNSEVAGVKVDERLIALYEGIDRARGEELALEVSARIAQAIAPYVDGYYLMTPFSRTALIVRLMERIRNEKNN